MKEFKFGVTAFNGLSFKKRDNLKTKKYKMQNKNNKTLY